MLGGNVPNHLVVGARTGFLTAMREPSYPYGQVSQTVVMSAASETLVDLGGAPMPVRSTGQTHWQDFIEKTMTIKPLDWENGAWISYNTVKDDQTTGGAARLEQKVRGVGRNFQRAINARVFQVLNAGDGSTYSLCYDGQYFFDTDHVDNGAHYSTSQSNLGALDLGLDNFETTYVAANAFKDDQGEYTNYMYNLLVVPPALERIASQITGNREAYDTANRETNPYSGKISYLVTPYFDSTAWALLAVNEAIKPILVVMREEPNLIDYGFDSNQPEGGRYWFKWYARYDVVYGDWRLAYMGKT